MSKFSLLTTLSLNAAGFDKGIDRATQKTQQFKKGTNDASKSIAASFTSMGGILGGAVNNQIGMLGQSILGGVSAFRSMIPAINSVKVALISSGIGAIVVALGVAFAALSSYLTDTTEGADKLNTFLGYIKGAFNAIIKRVNYFGSALSNLFSGDFAKFKDDLNNTFKGGLWDEIKDDAQEFKQFADEQNRLKKEKISLDSAEAKLAADMARLQTDARNKLLTDDQRRKKQVEFKKLDAQLDTRKQKYLYDEWQLQLKINTIKGKSVGYSDLEAASQKEVAYYKELQADAQEDVRINKIDYQLQGGEQKTATEAIADNIKALESQREAMVASGENIDAITKQIIAERAELEKLNSTIAATEAKYATIAKLQIKGIAPIPTADNQGKAINGLSGTADQNRFKTENLKQYIDYIDLLNGQLKDTEQIASFTGTAIDGLSDAFIAMAEGAEVSFKSLVMTMLDGIKQIIMGLLAKAIAGMVAGEASKGLPGLILAGIGITGIMALFNSLPKFAAGGIFGGASMTGDRNIARVNSGEMILNQAQQAKLFEIANGGRWGVGAEVEFKIRGTELVGVLSNHNRMMQKTR